MKNPPTSAEAIGLVLSYHRWYRPAGCGKKYKKEELVANLLATLRVRGDFIEYVADMWDSSAVVLNPAPKALEPAHDVDISTLGSMSVVRLMELCEEYDRYYTLTASPARNKAPENRAIVASAMEFRNGVFYDKKPRFKTALAGYVKGAEKPAAVAAPAPGLLLPPPSAKEVKRLREEEERADFYKAQGFVKQGDRWVMEPGKADAEFADATGSLKAIPKGVKQWEQARQEAVEQLRVIPPLGRAEVDILGEEESTTPKEPYPGEEEEEARFAAEAEARKVQRRKEAEERRLAAEKEDEAYEKAQAEKKRDEEALRAGKRAAYLNYDKFPLKLEGSRRIGYYEGEDRTVTPAGFYVPQDFTKWEFDKADTLSRQGRALQILRWLVDNEAASPVFPAWTEWVVDRKQFATLPVITRLFFEIDVALGHLTSPNKPGGSPFGWRKRPYDIDGAKRWLNDFLGFTERVLGSSPGEPLPIHYITPEEMEAAVRAQKAGTISYDEYIRQTDNLTAYPLRIRVPEEPKAPPPAPEEPAPRSADIEGAIKEINGFMKTAEGWMDVRQRQSKSRQPLLSSLEFVLEDAREGKKKKWVGVSDEKIFDIYERFLGLLEALESAPSIAEEVNRGMWLPRR
jgi:hypothetical protein